MLQIENPKQDRSTLTGRDAWYPYYAGFSMDFARNLLSSANLKRGALVLDPWNGAGTTTAAAKDLGFRAIGYDLNPAMVVAAKARSLSRTEKNSLGPIACDILRKASAGALTITPIDGLLGWFSVRGVAALRQIEAAIQRLLIGKQEYRYLSSAEAVNQLSDLAAFYYTALFRTVRHLLRRFVSSNPTWTKLPPGQANRLRPTAENVMNTFKSQVELMIQTLDEEEFHPGSRDGVVELLVANSENLPLGDAAADFALCSPPYCTRIDYAIATMSELAILGFDLGEDLKSLRRAMIGTSTVPREVSEVSRNWGSQCTSFLQQVATHPSKASGTYYYKSHVQYFSSMFRSLAELARVIKPGGRCVMVAQDSYYKEVHNDLPAVLVQMMANLGLQVEQRSDFPAAVIMANLHPAARRYRSDRRATESVICFRAA